MTEAHDYTYWRNALEGKFGEIHPDLPQAGFYKKKKHKKDGWDRVAIWKRGEMVVAINGRDSWFDPVEKEEVPFDANEIWTYCADKPITHELYQSLEDGGEWPDAIPGIGDNQPPEEIDDLEALKEEIESARAIAEGYVTIISKDQCDQASNLRDRLNSLSKQANELRVAEKKPHDEAAKAVQAKWKPVVEAAKEAADWLRGPMTEYMTRVEKEREEANKKAQEAVEEKRRKQAERAEKAAKRGVAPPIEEEIADATPVEAVKAGGSSGRRAGLRTVTEYEITDYEACLAFVKDTAEVREAVEKAAIRMVKVEVKVPGIEKKTSKVAA